MTTYAYSRSGAIIATEASGRVQSFAATSPEGVALLASGIVPAPYVEPAPAVVSRRQAKRALHAAGLLASVETAMTSAPMEMQIDWQDAVEFRRDSPTIAAMAAGLGLSPAQIDALFVAASQVNA